jgi:Zn finger protein HypA/HybF involved in hydrogenase expression
VIDITGPFLQKVVKDKTMSRKVAQKTKKIVAASQEWKCKACSSILKETYEVDHIVALCNNGSNELSNLQALCPNCHRHKTFHEPKLKKREKIVVPEGLYTDVYSPLVKGWCSTYMEKHPEINWDKHSSMSVDELRVVYGKKTGIINKNITKKTMTDYLKNLDDIYRKMFK